MNIGRAARDIANLDSGVRPRNDKRLNIDFVFINIVPCFYFTGIVYVLDADSFVCVIPGPDPGIQVMVPNADTPARCATPAGQRGTYSATPKKRAWGALFIR